MQKLGADMGNPSSQSRRYQAAFLVRKRKSNTHPYLLIFVSRNSGRRHRILVKMIMRGRDVAGGRRYTSEAFFFMSYVT